MAPTDPPAMRLTNTDRAILEALAGPYIAGKPFPTPASNNAILEELAKRRLHLDLDTLRTHLRGLYSKFGAEEGLNAAAKRVRLCELVYQDGALPQWNGSPRRGPEHRPERTDPVPTTLSTLHGLQSPATTALAQLASRRWAVLGSAALMATTFMLLSRRRERLAAAATGAPSCALGSDTLLPA